jgi:cellulose 1,4-beta-cellobiosidase
VTTLIHLRSAAAGRGVGLVRGWLDQAKQQQDANGKPTVRLVVVYDLPNRDCSAFAAAGELKVADRRLERYRGEFIDPIAAELKAHPDQPIVSA